MDQKILYGIESLIRLVKNKKIFLVRDKSFDFLNIKGYFDGLQKVDFSEFTPNPLYEQVVEGVRLFNESKCEIIVAIGGGSTIDVAKCIKLYCKMNTDANYLGQEMFDSGIPVIAIPTTAGTGSESTKHAVIYFEGTKQSVSHVSIIPDYAILEPSVLETLPVYQKKCTMLDALCQAIESWWSVKANDKSKEYSRKAVTGIRGSWEEYIHENTEKSAQVIMESANYAGRAINITATTAAHAMSYKITSLYNLPHGHAVAVCMIEVWEYMLEHMEKCVDPRGEEYLKNTFLEIKELVDLNWFKKLFAELDMTYPVAQKRNEELEMLTKAVNPTRLKNNPVELSPEVLKKMYERIIK